MTIELTGLAKPKGLRSCLSTAFKDWVAEEAGTALGKWRAELPSWWCDLQSQQGTWPVLSYRANITTVSSYHAVFIIGLYYK